MQTPKAQPISLTLTDKTQPQLRVTRGNLQQFAKGDIFRISVGVVTQGKTDINIQGKSITLESLNKSLQDTIITIKIIKAGKHPSLEIQQVQRQIKSGINKAEQASNPQQQITSAKTSLNQTLIAGKQAFAAQVSAEPPVWLRHAKQPLSAIATEQHGKRITLRTTSTKLLARTTKGETQHPQLQIENPGRSIKIGEQFDIQLIAPRRHGKPLLQLQPQTSQSKLLATAKAATSPAFTFSANETIITEVKQRLASGLITFQWKKQSFEAAAPKHVQPGDALHLQVVKTGGKPTLKVLEHVAQAKEKAAAIFRQHIGKTATQQNVLNTINRIATEVPPTANPIDQSSSAKNSISPQLAASISTLSTWIDNYAIPADQSVARPPIATTLQQLGQQYESKLLQHLRDSGQNLKNIAQHDLKAILLRLSEANSQQLPSSKAGRISHAAEQGVARIESQQALNLMAIMQNNPIRFDLPILVAGQLANVHLSIQQEQHSQQEHDDDNRTETQAYNILFALNLTGLGTLRIDARITSKSVNARFYHDNDISRRFVQKNIPRLVDKLESIGYKSIYLGTASQHRMNLEKETQFAQLLNNIPSGDSLLDIRA